MSPLRDYHLGEPRTCALGVPGACLPRVIVENICVSLLWTDKLGICKITPVPLPTTHVSLLKIAAQ